MKYNVIVSDPPWHFSDKLTMSDVKRGAGSNYTELTVEEIKSLDVKSISEDDAVLALWTPSTHLAEGLDVMQSWGFKYKQTHVWVKVKNQPGKNLKKDIEPKDLEATLAFGMGHLFRQTHELVLLGVRGKISSLRQNKAQRSVHFYPVTKHSVKPEYLQDKLDIMFPNLSKLEMFARRLRTGWECIGNESPSSPDEDIRDSIKRLQSL